MVETRAAERKEKVIVIRVTADQKRRLEQAAGTAGLELSSWMRSLALKEARRLGVNS